MPDRKKRVFVLGAGASAHANAPLADGMLPDAYDPRPESPWYPEPDYDDERRHVDHALGVVARHGIRSGRMNLEEILTEIDIRLLSPRVTRREEDELTLAREILVQFVLKRFMPDEVKDESGATRRFCEGLHAGDVVVTFNYDVLLEQALWALDRWSLKHGYGFDVTSLFPFTNGFQGRIAEDPRELVTVLKPHGSVSWRSLSPDTLAQADEPGGATLVFWAGDLDGLDRHVWLCAEEQLSTGSHEEEQERSPRGFLMPSFVKSYADTSPFIRHMWHLAYEAIRQASELWIIGYSIPEADTDAHLLLSALPRRSGKGQAAPEWTVNIADKNAESVAKRMERIVSLNEGRVFVRSNQKFEECDWGTLLADG